MTDAPERIWAFPKKDWFNAGASTKRITTAGAKDVCYVRKDLYDAQAARIAELEAVLEIVEKALHEHDTANYGWDEENPWTMGEWFDESDRAKIAAAHAALPQEVSLQDMPETEVGDIVNYYGGLVIRCVAGQPEWSIENYDGNHWEACPPAVFAALRDLSEDTQ